MTDMARRSRLAFGSATSTSTLEAFRTLLSSSFCSKYAYRFYGIRITFNRRGCRRRLGLIVADMTVASAFGAQNECRRLANLSAMGASVENARPSRESRLLRTARQQI